MWDDAKATSLRSTSSDTNPTVLVVDDNLDIRETIRLALEDEGYAVLEASDGASALDILRESSLRLVVLLDQIMPGVDGIETLDIIGRDERLARRHAYLMMTANSAIRGPEIVAPGVELEVPLVTKPFDIDDLLGAVEQAAATLRTGDAE